MKHEHFLNIVKNKLKLPFLKRAVAFDFETEAPEGFTKMAAVDARVAKPTLLSVSTRQGTRYYSAVFDWSPKTAALLRELTTYPIPLVAHNCYFDITLAVFNNAIPRDLSSCRCTFFDTMLNGYMLNDAAEERKYLGLKVLVPKYVGATMSTFEQANSFLSKIAEETKHKNELNAKFASRSVKISERRKKLEHDKALLESQSKQHLKKYTDLVEKYDKLIEEGNAEIVRLNQEIIKSDDLIKSYAILHESRFRQYAKDDAKYTLALFYKTMKLLDEEKMLSWYYVESEVRTASIQMGINGIRLDVDALEKTKKMAEIVAQDLYSSIFRLAGIPFESVNINSGEQLSKLLWETMKLPVPLGTKKNKPTKKNPEGYYSVEREVLYKLTHKIGQELLSYKVATKLLTSTLKSLVNAVGYNPFKEQRINFNFVSTTNTKTGRFSSNGFELTKVQGQNIDSKEKDDHFDERVRGLGVSQRRAFIAERKKKLLILDQSQIELRLNAHKTLDPNLVSVFTEKVEYNGMTFHTGDLHAKTSKEVGVPRKLAKNLNFGRFYGAGDFRFAKMANLYVDTPERMVEFNKCVVDYIKNKFETDDMEFVNKIATDADFLRSEYIQMFHRDPHPYEFLRMTFCNKPDGSVLDLYLSAELGDKMKMTYPAPFIMHSQFEQEKRDKAREMSYKALTTKRLLKGKDANIKNEIYWNLISGRRLYETPEVPGHTIFNHWIQGSAADLLKIVIFVYWKYIKKTNKIPSLNLLMQIHDELVFEVDEEDAEKAIIVLKYLLEYPWFAYAVPIYSSAKICDNWAQKDDDTVPEFGVFYYETKDGKQHTVTPETWGEYVKADSLKQVVRKSATGVLTQEQKEYAASIVGAITENFDRSGRRYLPMDSLTYKERVAKET